MTRSAQPETGFVKVNGTQLHYETLGQGHPLVLIHGGFMDRRRGSSSTFQRCGQTRTGYRGRQADYNSGNPSHAKHGETGGI